MNELLAIYKNLIDFNDKTQKSNYKFVESYLRFQKRKNYKGWEDDCIAFLKDAIDLQRKFTDYIRNYNMKFNLN